MLELWFGSYLLERLTFVRGFWKVRRIFAAVLVVFVSVSSVWLCLQLGMPIGVVFGLLATYRVMNLLRIVKNRMHDDYLKQAAQRTSTSLFVLHLLTVVSVMLIAITPNRLLVLQIIQVIVALFLLLVVAKNVNKLGYKAPTSFLSSSELPTVSVLIPARNETKDLQECLRSVLASDYPKLEIVVLDDCSQGKTADIIKSFAQSGVRFTQGKPPETRWLAKNQAYQQLLDESSGEIVVFCGVDVRMGAQAIRSMVNVLVKRKKKMLSVLPMRQDSSPKHAFIQPMRYWWELALPRRLFNRPPVLSTCWMVKRKVLDKAGGFGAVSHSILPEAFFARLLILTDEYSFIRSAGELDIKTAKSFKEQFNSAIRTHYPKIRKRPEWAFVLTLLNLVLLFSPFALLVASFWMDSVNPLLALVSCLALTLSNIVIINATDPANSLFSAVTFPLAILSELFLGYKSMLQYEFFTVEWKDRNVCLPVMHAIPHLPKV